MNVVIYCFFIFSLAHKTNGFSRIFDVAVIGGGHAGIEAACAAARLRSAVALISPESSIGTLACNPSVGGLGKGHILREIDALDGILPRAADSAAIHYRLLNSSKGSAVQGPRAQLHRSTFRRKIINILNAYTKNHNLSFLSNSVHSLSCSHEQPHTLTLDDGTVVFAKTVVLALGTFVHGSCLIGSSRKEGGRDGEPAARLRILEEIGDVLNMKTGTPPRICEKSVEWDKCEKQPSDVHPTYISHIHEYRTHLKERANQSRTTPCYLTYTTPDTHKLVEEFSDYLPKSEASNLLSPRYCPSLPLKVERFRSKERHPVWLEPDDEGLVYCAGLSGAFPVHIQEKILHSIPGLSKAKIVKPGYDVTYQALNPNAIHLSLESKRIPRLYLAGQIMGTTGYEEAAGLGLMAGTNAALKVQSRSPFILGRDEAYLGVMISDLTKKGVDEPYRMFTGRAESRLELRMDDSDIRLTGLAPEGLISKYRKTRVRAKAEYVAEKSAELKSLKMSINNWRAAGFHIPHVEKDPSNVKTAWDLLKANISLTLTNFIPKNTKKSLTFANKTIEANCRYSDFVLRQKRINSRWQDGFSKIPFPLHLFPLSREDYPCLSNEEIEKLNRHIPSTFEEAAMIPGVTQKALAYLISRPHQHKPNNIIARGIVGSTQASKELTRLGATKRSMIFPGAEKLITQRFLFDPSTSRETLQERLIRDWSMRQLRFRNAERLRSAVIVSLAVLLSWGLSLSVKAIRRFLIAQQTRLIEEEKLLYGSFTSPKATYRGDKK